MVEQYCECGEAPERSQARQFLGNISSGRCRIRYLGGDWGGHHFGQQTVAETAHSNVKAWRGAGRSLR
jgi:hypothetical protein